MWRPVEYHNKVKGANPWRRVAHYILPVVVFSILFNTPKFLEVEFVDENVKINATHSQNRTLASPTELRLDDAYVVLYVNVARLLVQGVIPFGLLSVFNYRIYWVIKRRRQMTNRPAAAPATSTTTAAATTTTTTTTTTTAAATTTISDSATTAPTSVPATSSAGQAPPAPPPQRSSMAQQRLSSAQRKASETQQAVVLFIIVLLFFVCHTPRFVLNVHEFLTLDSLRRSIKGGCNEVSLWALIIASVSHFLMTLNSSVNFFIYCYMCSTFRRCLFRLLHRCASLCGLCTCAEAAIDAAAAAAAVTSAAPESPIDADDNPTDHQIETEEHSSNAKRKNRPQLNGANSSSTATMLTSECQDSFTTALCTVEDGKCIVDGFGADSATARSACQVPRLASREATSTTRVDIPCPSPSRARLSSAAEGPKQTRNENNGEEEEEEEEKNNSESGKANIVQLEEAQNEANSEEARNGPYYSSQEGVGEEQSQPLLAGGEQETGPEDKGEQWIINEEKSVDMLETTL